MTEPVSASPSHTLVCRFPGLAGCGTRVHTIPVAFATSTAATRSRTCSYPASSISCGTIIASTLTLASPSGHAADARGPQ